MKVPTHRTMKPMTFKQYRCTRCGHKAKFLTPDFDEIKASSCIGCSWMHPNDITVKLVCLDQPPAAVPPTVPVVF